MIRFKVLHLDAGGAGALAWAKRQCARLIARGVRSFSKTWSFGDFEITAHCTSLSRGALSTDASGDQLVKIRIAGALERNRLYDWPRQMSAINFDLSPFPKASASPIPTSKVVTPVPDDFPKLGDMLDFVTLPASSSLSTYAFSTSKLVQHFNLLAKTKKWLLRQWMEQAITVYVDRVDGDPDELKPAPGRITPDDFRSKVAAGTFNDSDNASLNYWRPQLRISFDDCAMSEPDADGNCYFLLGSFRDPDKAKPDDPCGFRGVIVSSSVLFAANLIPAGVVSKIQADISTYGKLTLEQRISVHVFGPKEYTRKSLGTHVYSDPGIVGLNNESINRFVSSPFNVTYERREFWTYLGDTGVPPDGFDFESKYFIDQHGVSSTGELEIVPYDITSIGSESGQASWTRTDTASADWHEEMTATDCGLTFFNGEELIEVGDVSFEGRTISVVAGAGTRAGGNIDVAACLPVNLLHGAGFDELDFSVDQYLSEYGLLRSGDVLVDDITDRSMLASAPTNSAGMFSAGIAWSRQTFDRPAVNNSVRTEDGYTFGLAGGGLFNTGQGSLAPRESGLPIVTTQGDNFVQTNHGGVFWYRDGPTGVLIFSVDPATTDKRDADRGKYINVIRQEVGYRRVSNPGGDFTNEANYEDPDLILERIKNATTILVNNFASPALLPWLDVGVLGIIL